MVTQGNIRGGQQGVTLVELLVGVVVAATIIAAGFAVLTSSSKALTTNEQTVETQQNVRLAMEFLFRDIRQAGFGMNGPVGNCPTAIVPADLSLVKAGAKVRVQGVKTTDGALINRITLR